MSSFDKNDRDAILAALHDPNPDNPIVKALTERLTECMDNLAALTQRTGTFPTELVLVKPSTAFDDIVIRLCLQEVAKKVAETLGQKLTLYWL